MNLEILKSLCNVSGSQTVEQWAQFYLAEPCSQVAMLLTSIEASIDSAVGKRLIQTASLDQVQRAVIVTTLQGQITYWNRYAEVLYQWSALEAIGQDVTRLLPIAPSTTLTRKIFIGTVRSQVWQGTLWLRRKHDSPFQAEVTSTIATDAAGHPIGFIGITVPEPYTAADPIAPTLRKQSDRTRLMGAIALRIHQSLDLTEILDSTVADVRQFLSADRGLIYHFDREGKGTLVAHSTDAGWPLHGAIEFHTLWYRSSQARDELGQRQISHQIDWQALPPDYRALLQTLQVQAKLVVPIPQSDRLWGVLVMHQCSSPRQWQPFEVDFMEQVATQMAIAIQQAQLFSQLQQQAQREALLNQIGRAINSSLDPDQILQEIVERTGECFQVDRVLIYTLNGEIRAQHEWLSSAQVPSLLSFVASLSDWPDLLDPESEFSQRRVFYADDLRHTLATKGRQVQIDRATRSVLCVPIFIRDRLFGAVALHTATECRTFNEGEIQLLQQIADQAAIALYNAQSYEQLEQLVRERTQELEREKLLSEAANLAKTEFLATMSHELRTPLNAVLGLSQLLQQEIFGPLNAKQAEYVSHIHSSGDHLLLLINDILDLAKVEAGRETLSRSIVAVPELCRYCLTLVQEQACDRGLQLTSQFDPSVQTCIADERRLKQMLLNLLSNAIKFTSIGSVALQVTRQSNGIAFTIADTGIGIAPEKLPMLFQPFSQLDSQLNRTYAGTGLGLALTRKLARLHQGDITVESTPGQGSRFTLLLPDRWDASGLSNSDITGDRGDRPAWKTGRILMVEDNDSSALLLKDYLQAIGYQVDHLDTSAGFLNQVRALRPSLILLDVQLSGSTTGLDLLHELRRTPDLRQSSVVMVTAMAMAGDRDRFLQAGADDYLSKPLDIVQLESVLLKYV